MPRLSQAEAQKSNENCVLENKAAFRCKDTQIFPITRNHEAILHR